VSLTLDVIGLAGFGFDFHALDKQLSEQHGSYNVIVKYLLNPFRFFVPYFDYFPIPMVTKAMQGQRELKNLMRNIIAKKRESPASSSSDILDVMINTQHVEPETEDDPDDLVDSYKHKKRETMHMNEQQLQDNLFFVLSCWA